MYRKQSDSYSRGFFTITVAYVESATNTADDASRGLSADELVKSDRWRFGPDFLWCDECD